MGQMEVLEPRRLLAAEASVDVLFDLNQAPASTDVSYTAGNDQAAYAFLNPTPHFYPASFESLHTLHAYDPDTRSLEQVAAVSAYGQPVLIGQTLLFMGRELGERYFDPIHLYRYHPDDGLSSLASFEGAVWLTRVGDGVVFYADDGLSIPDEWDHVMWSDGYDVVNLGVTVDGDASYPVNGEPPISGLMPDGWVYMDGANVDGSTLWRARPGVAGSGEPVPTGPDVVFSNPRNFVDFDGRTFFITDHYSGRQLGVTDGTADGSAVVVNPDSSDWNAPDNLDDLIVLDHGLQLVDSQRNKHYISDGTVAGTQLINAIFGYVDAGVGFSVVSKRAFVDGAWVDALQAVDGSSPDGVVLTTLDETVFDDQTVLGFEGPGEAAALPDGRMIFRVEPRSFGAFAREYPSPVQTWITDGTAQGTRQLPGGAAEAWVDGWVFNRAAMPTTVPNGVMLIEMTLPEGGFEPFLATGAGLEPIEDPTPTTKSSYITGLHYDEGRLLIAGGSYLGPDAVPFDHADEEATFGVFQHDLSTGETVKLATGEHPAVLEANDLGTLLYVDTPGEQLQWIAPDGTHYQRGISSGRPSLGWQVVGDDGLLRVVIRHSFTELFAWEPISNQYERISDRTGISPSQPMMVNGRIYYGSAAPGSSAPRELFRTDGTLAGTEQVTDFGITGTNVSVRPINTLGLPGQMTLMFSHSELGGYLLDPSDDTVEAFNPTYPMHALPDGRIAYLDEGDLVFSDGTPDGNIRVSSGLNTGTASNFVSGIDPRGRLILFHVSTAFNGPTTVHVSMDGQSFEHSRTLNIVGSPWVRHVVGGSLVLLDERNAGINDDASPLWRITPDGQADRLGDLFPDAGPHEFPTLFDEDFPMIVEGNTIYAAGLGPGTGTEAMRLRFDTRAPEVADARVETQQAVTLDADFLGPIDTRRLTPALIGPDGPIEPTQLRVTVDGDQVRIDFAPDGTPRPLPNGSYRFELRGVADAWGNVAETVAIDFDVLNGDLDGDRDVDLFDAALLERNFGRTDDPTFAEGDIDYDGDVDLFDAALLERNFGSTLMPPARGLRGGPSLPSLFSGKRLGGDDDADAPVRRVLR